MVSFSNIKKGLGLTDTLTFGKFRGCRIDTLLEQDYEYILWLHLKMKPFTKEVVDKAYFYRKQNDDERYYQEEVAPFDDIPF